MQVKIVAALFFAFAFESNAAVPLTACEADDATFQLLSQWRFTSSDATLTFDARMAPLWKAIEAQPGNVFLHHAYQKTFLNYIESIRVGAVAENYRKLLALHPDNLTLRYAYARLLYGNRTAEEKTILEEIVAADPDFAWVHLELAHVYQNNQFRSEIKYQEETKHFSALCPGTLAGEAYEAYKKMPQEFRVQAAQALRERLKNAETPRQLAALPSLWIFEFQGAEAERVQVSARVAKDLVRVRKLAENDFTLLNVALEGYNLIEDREGSRWTRERTAAVAPRSFAVCDVVMNRWYSDRARPTMEDSRERVQGYYRELLEATDQWIQMCPLYEAPWRSRYQAIRELPDLPTAKVLQTGEGLLRASQANSSNWFVAPSMPIGELYEQREIGFDQIPTLIERNRRDAEARLASDRNLDWLPASWKESNVLEASESYVVARVLSVRKYLHDGKREQAIQEMAAAEREAGSVSGEKTLWVFEPHLINGYLALHDSAQANAHLRVLKEWLETHQPSEATGPGDRLTFRDRQSRYWELAGELADLEKDTASALIAYQNVLQYRSRWDTLAARFTVIDKTERLWRATGGTGQAWQQWLTKITATIAVPAQDWEQINRNFPAFTLLDLGGKKWTQDSLKGKITVINLWATWCGPCVAELPYIQKIQDAMKGREDIQVITFNIDENPGLIEPFLKQHSLVMVAVIPAADYVLRTLQVNGFPRTWIVERDGVARREQAGFTGEPAKWVELVLASLK